jgi:hypothetical protein
LFVLLSHKHCNFFVLTPKKVNVKKIEINLGLSWACFAKTAEHHEIHLKEYIAIEKLPLNITGFEVKGGNAIAFMVVTDEHMVQVRDALKHRGNYTLKNNNQFPENIITLKFCC